MKRLRAVAGELAGLFVEDGTFALAISVWVSIVGSAATSHTVAPLICGIALFAGLALLLIWSVATAARKS